MNRILIWNSGITFLIVALCSYLSLEGLTPAWSLPLVTLAVAAMYAISIDSFWKKVSSDDNTEKHLRKLVRMLIKHRRDDETLRVIVRRLSNEEMYGTLRNNYTWIVEELIKGEDDKKHHLFTVIRTICDLIREHAVKCYTEDMKSLTQGHVLHATNHELVRLFNEKVKTCFLHAGGYPTWTDVHKVLEPIFNETSKDDVEKFLLAIEADFRPSPTRALEYLQVEAAYRQLTQSLRRQILARAEAHS